MWIIVADRLLTTLNSPEYFSQGFADDFSILVEGIDLSTACKVMQAALRKLERWCEDQMVSRQTLRRQKWYSSHEKGASI